MSGGVTCPLSLPRAAASRIDSRKKSSAAPAPYPTAGSVMRIGTGRKPLRSSSHSEASSLPSSGSVKRLRLSVVCANAEPANSDSRNSAVLAAPTAAAAETAAALETAPRTLLRGARLARLARVGLPVERVDRLAAARPAAARGLLRRAIGAAGGLLRWPGARVGTVAALGPVPADIRPRAAALAFA